MGLTSGIILAGGIGERFNSEVPKQFVKVAGKRVVEHTLDVFNGYPAIDEIIVVCPSEYIGLIENCVLKNKYNKVTKIVTGGASRQESSWCGLNACSNNTEYVVIHDAARPMVTHRIIDDILAPLKECESTDTIIATADTIVQATSDGKFIDTIPDRQHMRRGQTPQGFRFNVIKHAHELAREEDYNDSPDDCGLVLRYKLGRVRLVAGDEQNIKITHPIDVYIADRLYQLRTHSLRPLNFEQFQTALKDKVLVVFGGTSGIGESISLLASRLGLSVYSYGPEKDVREYQTILETLQTVDAQVGKIDFIVNTAGILQMAFIEMAETELIKAQIDVNLIGAINVCKAAIKFLKNTAGHIVLFTSSSYTRGRAGYTPYSCSKAALVNFAQGFSEEVSRYGIKVNTVNPERTKTPMRVANFGKEDESLLLKPQTVAIQCLNLLTRSITGTVVDVRRNEEQHVLETFGQNLK